MPAVGFELFDRELRLSTQALTGEGAEAMLAQFARQQLQQAISEGASPQYETFVNGRRGASEDTVTLPGNITYVFTNWPIVIAETIKILQSRVPRRTGRYSRSFVVLANQVLVTDYNRIPATAEVIIFNIQPYTRKMETGALNEARVGARHFDLTPGRLRRRFGSDVFRFEVRYLDIRGGVAPDVPYILKTSKGRRKDRQAGQPISYPAIVINMI